MYLFKAQWKHQDSAWELLKVDNKGMGTFQNFWLQFKWIFIASLTLEVQMSNIQMSEQFIETASGVKLSCPTIFEFLALFWVNKDSSNAWKKYGSSKTNIRNLGVLRNCSWFSFWCLYC